MRSTRRLENRSGQRPAIHYQRLTLDTIPALQGCIRRTYGDSYPFHWFYERSTVERMLDEGRLIAVVAINEEQRVVGTMGMILMDSRNKGGDYTADSIAAMVDEDYRGLDVLMRLGTELFQAFKEYALAGVHLYALALHDVVQKRSIQRGRAIITGILPAYFTRDTCVVGFETGSHRIGAVALFQPVFTVAPQRSIYLPAPYVEVLQGIYEELPLPRKFASAEEEKRDWYQLPERSVCEVQLEPSNREAKLRVFRVGEDLAERLSELQQQAQRVAALYVDFALSDTAIQRAVKIANAEGFCFGALLPERYQTDWLRLQCYDDEDVSLEAMVVATEEGKKLVQFVGQDRARISTLASSL